ncbi:unnamed protein product [Moneuplotes crassus]|uniref:Uncharacterized protein n=1 Tax=Euplotes crassus TaxID=5936 RepID=A0AAD2D2B3_EUPCR|nr:unnamed protein product [Moneuplotes crassus]
MVTFFQTNWGPSLMLIKPFCSPSVGEILRDTGKRDVGRKPFRTFLCERVMEIRFGRAFVKRSVLSCLFEIVIRVFLDCKITVLKDRFNIKTTLDDVFFYLVYLAHDFIYQLEILDPELFSQDQGRLPFCQGC